MYEPSLLLAESLAFELRAGGHVVDMTCRRDDLVDLARRQAPDLVLVTDLLDRQDVLPLVQEVGRLVSVPVLVVATDPQRVADRADGQVRTLGVVGSGRSLRTVMRAVEETADGRTVHEPDVKAVPRRRGRSQALTPREREVVTFLASGASTSRIAGELRVSASTARTYVQQVLQKLDAHSRIEAVSIAGLEGVRPPRDPVRRERRRAARQGK